MKTKVKIEQEIEVSSILITVPVRFEEEDIPNDFPLRSVDVWEAKVAVDTGRIVGWPSGKTGDLYMKVCDEGTYTLLGLDGQVLAARRQEYVPHGIVPGEYGDYIDLKINADGVITNWPKKPDVSAFFPED